MASGGERRLAAIMYTDIVGYTALTQSNEAQAIEVLERHNKLLRPFFPRFHGREVKALGDGFLIEFENALDAVRCASKIQSYLHDYNLSSRDEWKIKLRIGIHLGDIIRKGGDVFGDAVNIASRVQPIAAPEGICVSEQVYDQVQNKLDTPMVSLGEKSLKNVSIPVAVYRVQMPWEQPVAAEMSTFATNRIAVLPFRNMSPDPNDEYFAEGMTEEIISTVSGISGLEVISRTSVMRYKKTEKAVEEIGRELKVGSVLEGSFRKAGNRIRVTTQLIEVAKDRHLWAQNYDRSLDDIFEVQSDVAKQVADALRVRILAPEKERIESRPTESTAAYTFYLKGRSFWNRRGLEDMRRAMECFELAVHEDPGFALGYAGLADCAILLAANWHIDKETNISKAKETALKALGLDPALGEVHATLGLVCQAELAWHKAEEEYRKAIALKPSYATAHQGYMWVLIAELRWDEAQKEAEEAVELDPLSGRIMENLAELHFLQGNFGKAAEKLKVALELGDVMAHGKLVEAYGMMKMYDQMEREGDAFIMHYQDFAPRIRTAVDCEMAYLRGDREAVRKLLPELEAHPKETFTTPTSIAVFYFFLGEVKKGFEWLELAYSEKDIPGIAFIQSYQDLDGIRTDPRYLDLLKRLGLDQTSQTK